MSKWPLQVYMLYGWSSQLKFVSWTDADEPGFIGFDSPIHDDNDLFGDVDQPDNEEPIEDANIENFQSYQRNAIDMQKHEQNQIEMVSWIFHTTIEMLFYVYLL